MARANVGFRFRVTSERVATPTTGRTDRQTIELVGVYEKLIELLMRPESPFLGCGTWEAIQWGVWGSGGGSSLSPLFGIYPGLSYSDCSNNLFAIVCSLASDLKSSCDYPVLQCCLEAQMP